MKNKPIIINTSRGGIINESDLIEAYHKNIISGFALDVFEKEPIESEFYNKIKPGMNCILTPHISGVTTESNIRVSDFIVKKITDFFNLLFLLDLLIDFVLLIALQPLLQQQQLNHLLMKPLDLNYLQ